MIKTNLFFRNFPISISSLVITIIICFIGFQEFETTHTHTPFFYQVFFVSHVLLFCINIPQICRYIKDYWSFQKQVPLDVACPVSRPNCLLPYRVHHLQHPSGSAVPQNPERQVGNLECIPATDPLGNRIPEGWHHPGGSP